MDIVLVNKSGLFQCKKSWNKTYIPIKYVLRIAMTMMTVNYFNDVNMDNDYFAIIVPGPIVREHF